MSFALFKETLVILCKVRRLSTHGSKEALVARLVADGFDSAKLCHFITYCKVCNIHDYTERIIPPLCNGCGVCLVGWRIK